MFDFLPSPLTCFAVFGYFVLNLCLNYYNAFILGNGGGTGRGLHLPIPVGARPLTPCVTRVAAARGRR